jgi:hypothetical protein
MTLWRSFTQRGRQAVPIYAAIPACAEIDTDAILPYSTKSHTASPLFHCFSCFKQSSFREEE